MKRWYFLLVALTVGLLFVPGTLFSSTEALFAFGIIRGFLIVVVLYTAFMWVYFAMRKRTQIKFAAEIAVVAIVLVLSVAGKALVTFVTVKAEDPSAGSDSWNGTAVFYYAIYQAIGGLSFEGLADYGIYETGRMMFYAGSSLVAGLVALSIITFSLSYEIYSYFAWNNFPVRKGSKIYVFTAITEDSLALAHSIDEENKKIIKKEKSFSHILSIERRIQKDFDGRNATGKKKRVLSVYLRALKRYLFGRRKYVIIFLRTEGQEAFDGKNPLHLDIMHSGFLFRSYNPGSKDKSIPEFLGIKVKNDGFITDSGKNEYYDDMRRDAVEEIHIFALHWEKEKTSENDKIVFEDISRITKEVMCKKMSRSRRAVADAKYRAAIRDIENSDAGEDEKRRLKEQKRRERTTDYLTAQVADYGRVVNYHYLVSEDIDVSNVDMRFDKELSKFAPSETGRDGGECDLLARAGEAALNVMGSLPKKAETYYQTFRRHFSICALNEAEMAARTFVRKKAALVRSCPELYASELLSREYKAMVIGFGQNGQQTMKAAYLFAASGTHGKADKAERKEWTKSPLLDYVPQDFFADVYDKNALELGALFRMKHPSVTVVAPGSESAKYANDQVRIKLKLNRVSVFSDMMLNKLDKITGDTGTEKESESTNARESLRGYNLIIIALGDDDSNVNVANALIDDIRHELGRKKDAQSPYQIIAINLRDKLNYDRINWSENDKRKFNRLKVVRYGSVEEMYSFESIVDRRGAKLYNSVYAGIDANSLSNAESKICNLNRDVVCVCCNKKSADRNYSVKDYILDIEEHRDNFGAIEKEWNEIGMVQFYKRYSSQYSSEFSPFVTEYYRIKFPKNKDVEITDVPLEDIIALGALEHDRWTRFMACNGYVLSPEKDLARKEHIDMIAYKDLKDDVQYYDMINILSAFCIEYRNKGGGKCVLPKLGVLSEDKVKGAAADAGEGGNTADVGKDKV